jgi:hypothetical protein
MGRDGVVSCLHDLRRTADTPGPDRTLKLESGRSTLVRLDAGSRNYPDGASAE